MDPLSAAGAFATIVGLLSTFKVERSGTDLAEFTTWLKERHHEDVVLAIERNSVLANEISNVLTINHAVLVERLLQIDSQISQIALQFEGFGGLVNALNPKAVLSEQAISILRQLVESGAECFMEAKDFTGAPDEYLLIGGAGGAINYDDQRFIKDDLESLVSAGIVRLDFGSKGSRKFLVTRAAAEFITKLER